MSDHRGSERLPFAVTTPIYALCIARPTGSGRATVPNALNYL